MPQFPDRATGQPMGTGIGSTVPYSQTGSQTTGPSSTTTTTGGGSVTNQTVSGFSSGVNSTPGAISALDQLISQLTERPDIDMAALEAKYPKIPLSFHPTMGWGGHTLPGSFAKGGVASNSSSADIMEYNRQQDLKIQAEISKAPRISGGTANQKLQQKERATEIERNRTQQGVYSKDAAMTDANALIQKAISDALSKALPQITAGLEGAGTSRSTIAAGMTQDAAIAGAETGAAMGANLSAAYGGISAQLSGVLEALTRSDPNSPESMLLQAIIGSKGIVSAGGQSQTVQGTTQNTGSQVAVNSGNVVNATQSRVPSGTVTTPTIQTAAQQNIFNPAMYQPGGAGYGGLSGGYISSGSNNTSDGWTPPILSTPDSAQSLYGFDG